MLQQLSIKNYALIDHLTIAFDSGLNVLTGETGAGKSILMDALRLALGDRMSSSKALDDSQAIVIQAAFIPAAIPDSAKEMIRDYLQAGDELLLFKREISPEGRSKCSLNGQMVNLSTIKDAGAFLIDFHGQYDQQNIFKEAMHLELVDQLSGLAAGKNSEIRRQYTQSFAQYAAVKRNQKELMDKSKGKERQMDLLKFQIDEIEQVDPTEGEEETLTTERIRLAHAQRLYELTEGILSSLEEGDESASEKISQASRLMAHWHKIDPSAGDVESRLEDVQIKLEELMRDVRDYRDRLSFDEVELSGMQNRLDRIANLKRKYGPEIRDVLKFYEEIKIEYEKLLNSEIYQNDLESEMAALLPLLKKNADHMTVLRKKTAGQLKTNIESELKDLGMPHAKFECEFTCSEFSAAGQEHMRFLFSPNPGHGLKPLAEIASGGEASRIILALKRALMKVDQTPTLIFDEIDANLGGRLGEVVGQKLKEIATTRQVLLITHLPQIASFANKHFKVTKKTAKNKTCVEYQELDGDAKIKELAQMMSGSKETDISRSHAQEMLKSASK